MTRRFAWISAGLSATIGILVGAIVTGSMSPSPAVSAPDRAATTPPTTVAAAPSTPPALAAGFPASFADVADRVNPSVVSIDAASRSRRRATGPRPPEEAFGSRRPEAPRRGTGTGFLIDASGLILTNQHVVELADRVTVKLSDGRSFRARVVGTDPDTDIALLKVDSPVPLPHVTLGNSERLRVGEWVCAIGNPFAYEHTVTVGVVSFVGRKLFDQSLDHYIQTDAAISFGNSGGPLLNTAGEVVGINAAVSRQANNIGFSIPINQAKDVLPQLLATGRVARGYLGVALRDVDADVQHALGLGAVTGALVEDVTPGSPAERAGLRSYDLITAIDGAAVAGDDMAIRVVARAAPGQTSRIEYLRDGRSHSVVLKLAERPARELGPVLVPTGARPDAGAAGPSALGLTVIEVHEGNAHRYDVPAGIAGLLVQRVEPVSAAADAGLERGQVILHVNRRPVTTVAAFTQIVGQVRAGDPLAVLVYDPGLDQRVLRLLHADVP